MTTRFMLVRHATCALTEQLLFGRTLDAPLDARGQRQALAVARRLAHSAPRALLTSPRRRARQTAQAIGALCGSTPVVDARLDELDFGRWSGQSFAALEADPDWRRWNRARASSHTPAGDDIAQVQARLRAVFAAYGDAQADGNVVLVTHAEVIRAAVLAATGRHIDEFAAIPIAPASLTLLRVETRGLAVECINRITADEEPLTA